MNSTQLYPFRFDPVFRRYLWGGRRLASELNKEIGRDDCAESWEIVDRPEENSVVTGGELAGVTLHELIQRFGETMLGHSIHKQVTRSGLPDRLSGRFPLLLKFLDANKTLSVQVHPDDAAGLLKEVPDLGKTEAWYVMDAKPGSKIYCGLNEGVDRETLANAIANKTTDQMLHTFEPKRGDCVFVPAGTVHAIGDGLLIAEIQQSSDTTYRLFDWNRTDDKGNSRDLHVQQALDVTDFDRGPVNPVPVLSLPDDQVSELVRCDKFEIRRWKLGQDSIEVSLNDSFRLLMVMDGQMNVDGDPTGQPLSKGQSMLVPASMASLSVESGSNCEFLEIQVPTTG